MNRQAALLAIVLLSALCSFGFGEEKSELFLKAQAAYDNGLYAEASLLYEELLDNGISNTEVKYNLANAYFKNNDLPQAVLQYRKAWYAAPRDPDIGANMHFALNAAGAVEPSSNLIERTFTLFSKNTWIMVAIAGYILFTLLMILGMLIRPAKRALSKLSLLPAALILLSLGGWWHWHQLQMNPEWVVVKAGATTFFGPMEGSTAHYNIPLAAIVRQKNSDPKGWIEVEYDGKNGWLQEIYIRRVSP